MDKENKLFSISVVCILVSVCIMILSGDTNMKLNEAPPYIEYPALVLMLIGMIAALLWFIEINKQK